MLRARATHLLGGLGWTEIEANVVREQACIFEKSMTQNALVP